MPRNPLIERHSILKFGIDPDLAAHVARVGALPRNQPVDIGRAAPVVAYLKSTGLWANVVTIWTDFLGWQITDPATVGGATNNVDKLTGLKGIDFTNNSGVAGHSIMVPGADFGAGTAVRPSRVQTVGQNLPAPLTVLMRVKLTTPNYTAVIATSQLSGALALYPTGKVYFQDEQSRVFDADFTLQAGWQNVQITYGVNSTRFRVAGRPAVSYPAGVLPYSNIQFEGSGSDFRTLAVFNTVLSDDQADRVFQALGDNTPQQGRPGDTITPADARVKAFNWSLLGPGGAAQRGAGYRQSSDPNQTWQVTSGCNGLRLWYNSTGAFQYRLNEGAWTTQAGNGTWQVLELLNMPAGFYTLQVQPAGGTTQLENLEVI